MKCWGPQVSFLASHPFPLGPPFPCCCFLCCPSLLPSSPLHLSLLLSHLRLSPFSGPLSSLPCCPQSQQRKRLHAVTMASATLLLLPVAMYDLAGVRASERVGLSHGSSWLQ